MKLSSIPENLTAYKNLIILLLKYSNKNIFKSLDEKDILLEEDREKEKDGKADELGKDLIKMGPVL